MVALLCLSSWCLVNFVWLFLEMPRFCLQFVIVVYPDHSHLLFLLYLLILKIGNCLLFAKSTIDIFVVLLNYNKLEAELDIETTIPEF